MQGSIAIRRTSCAPLGKESGSRQRRELSKTYLHQSLSPGSPAANPSGKVSTRMGSSLSRRMAKRKPLPFQWYISLENRYIPLVACTVQQAHVSRWRSPAAGFRQAQPPIETNMFMKMALSGLDTPYGLLDLLRKLFTCC